jgi:valyl-tRNA synthetase
MRVRYERWVEDLKWDWCISRQLTLEQRRQALARRTAGETLMDIARTYNVSFATISRLKP